MTIFNVADLPPSLADGTGTIAQLMAWAHQVEVYNQPTPVSINNSGERVSPAFHEYGRIQRGENEGTGLYSGGFYFLMDGYQAELGGPFWKSVADPTPVGSVPAALKV